MPAANIERVARGVSTPSPALGSPLADFDPVLDLDARTEPDGRDARAFPGSQLLEPYGMGNPEPVFASSRRS